ncbi:hypothetical protein [Streptomyces phaeoluteigriseus]
MAEVRVGIGTGSDAEVRVGIGTGSGDEVRCGISIPVGAEALRGIDGVETDSAEMTGRGWGAAGPP